MTNTCEQLWGEIKELGLEPYIAELDVRGFTVIPPELTGVGRDPERYIELVLDVVEDDTGVRPNLETGEPFSGIGRIPGAQWTLINQGQPFEEALMDPVLLTLATYLVGYGCVVNAYHPMVKGPGGDDLELHCDAQLAMPVLAPLPSWGVVANLTYALTDYTVDNGCIVYVPGSHRRCSVPTGEQSRVPVNKEIVPVECPAGSLVVHHANTWHGAYTRRASGLRVSMQMYFARWFMRTLESHIDTIGQEVLDRNPPRFATLTGQHIEHGYSSMEDLRSRKQRAAKYREDHGEHRPIDLNFTRVPSVWD